MTVTCDAAVRVAAAADSDSGLRGRSLGHKFKFAVLRPLAISAGLSHGQWPSGRAASAAALGPALGPESLVMPVSDSP